MILARSPTASRTAASSAIFSASVVVGDSPVVPESTSPSHPESTRCVATFFAAATSSVPSGPNGVTMAVSTVPRRALTSIPLVVTGPRLPPHPGVQQCRYSVGEHTGAAHRRRDVLEVDRHVCAGHRVGIVGAAVGDRVDQFLVFVQ